MIIIGENINGSRNIIREKLNNRDSAFFCNLAEQQIEGGAEMLDINIGDADPEDFSAMQWLIRNIQKNINIPLCLDSPYPKIIKAGLETYNYQYGKPLINSITAEKERMENILPLVKKHQCSVIALLMDEKGIPAKAQERFLIAQKLIKEMTDSGISSEDIYLDPLVIPISTDSNSANVTLETLQLIHKNYPEIKTVAGMSNISYGLPKRKNINHAFLPLLLQSNISALILDTTDKQLMSLLYSSKALLGKDPYCKDYLQAYRKGKL